MAPVVECRIEPTSIFELLPIRVARDGDDYLIGHHRGRGYLALGRPALDAATWLGEGVPVGRVKQRLAAKYASDDVRLTPLLEQLISAGLVQAIDGKPIADRARPDPPSPPLLTATHVAPLFSRPAVTLYALTIIAGLAALLDSRTWPRLALSVADRGYATAALSAGLMLALVAKHEAAHLVAARFLGVEANWRLGHRLCFPVVETDLSGLWMVAPRRRYLAYAAGIVSDLLVASVAMMITWAHVAGYFTVTAGAQRALSLTVLIVAAGVIWQSNVFLRTDGYYMLSTALGCRNLAADAKAYLRDRSAAWPRAVRLYAIGYVFAVVVIGVLWVAGVVAAMTVDGAGANGARMAVAVSAGLLLIGVLAERRRATPRVRLVCPAGLAVLMAVATP